MSDIGDQDKADELGLNGEEASSEAYASGDKLVQYGEMLFNLRDYTPLPLIFILLLAGKSAPFWAALGTLVILLGELIRIYSVAFIGTVSRTRSRSTGSSLVSSGPFAVVRNPLYVGNFFIVLGFALFGGVLWILLLSLLAFFVQYFLIVKFEEHLLQKKFGEEYNQYRASVPAFWPKNWQFFGSLPWPSEFMPALISEKRTLTTIFVLLLLMSLFAG